MPKEVIMPALGMAQETGALIEWYKAEGDEVKQGEPLMLVATDKTEVEIEANASGVLANVTAQPGDEIPVGQVIALILAKGEAAPALHAATAALAANDAVSAVADLPSLPITPVAARIAAENQIDLRQVKAAGDRIQKEDVLAYLSTQIASAPIATNGRTPASPKARRLAQKNGVDIAEIAGSGPAGAVLAADVLAAIAQQAAPTQQPVAQPTTSTTSQSPISSPQPPLPQSRAWRVMAQRLQESWTTAPHFYLERSINARALLKWQEQLRERLAQKVTVTDLLVKLTALALRQHPRLNASWLEGEIVPNADVNMGLAVAVEDGLLVPVIHGAERLGIGEIAAQRANLVGEAQAGKLAPDAMRGGTFTISNLGMFGVTKFNAIVNPPQAAILAVGAIEERVVPVKGKPKVRPMLTLTLSCDHRVVDGAGGAQFLQTLVGYLEEPLRVLD
ncbi:MAG: dihydrolipoamide acetyltransferase family protein [Caldilineaceae bacterium]